ncbi:MAG: transporter substrate-binding domain-containing protein [Burkholderiaceae bacterium]
MARRSAALAAPLVVHAAVAAVAAEPAPVELYYFERPPYVVKHPGSDEVSGLTATPAAQAFRAAGLAFRWVPLPTVRQLVTLKEQAQAACAVGWFKNAERELQFKFSKPIYRDRPTVALARADLPAPAATLANQRASFMLAAEEEASYLLDQAAAPQPPLKIIHFSDLPPGERRHILCSKATPDEVIERLNKAIAVEP